MSAYSATASARTMGAPTALTARAQSGCTIGLTWNDNASGEAGFRIESALAAGGPWSQLPQTAPANATQFTSSGLACQTTYDSRVRAFDGPSVSSDSNVDKAKTRP